MFGLGRLFYVTVLLLNSVAILNEERFLKRLPRDEQPRFGAPEDTVTTRLFSLIRSIRTVMRPALIAINILIVVYEFIRIR